MKYWYEIVTDNSLDHTCHLTINSYYLRATTAYSALEEYLLRFPNMAVDNVYTHSVESLRDVNYEKLLTGMIDALLSIKYLRLAMGIPESNLIESNLVKEIQDLKDDPLFTSELLTDIMNTSLFITEKDIFELEMFYNDQKP